MTKITDAILRAADGLDGKIDKVIDPLKFQFLINGLDTYAGGDADGIIDLEDVPYALAAYLPNEQLFGGPGSYMHDVSRIHFYMSEDIVRSRSRTIRTTTIESALERKVDAGQYTLATNRS